MQSLPPRIAAIHDLSTFGRCSLGVAIPILSCMGLQVCAVPTALLSTHTGGFTGFAFFETTSFLPAALDHFQRLGLSFQSIYSGFLGSRPQIYEVARYLECYPDSFKLVDPVMGDEGKMYQTYTPDMCRDMAFLIRQADLITPNLTEAAILLDEEYPAQTLSTKTIKEWLCRLSQEKRQVVMTGVVEGTEIANYSYDHKTGSAYRSSDSYLSAHYPGTGDIFASVLLGSLLQGHPLPSAAEIAGSFVSAAVRVTMAQRTPPRDGVILELLLPELWKQKNKSSFEKI